MAVNDNWVEISPAFDLSLRSSNFDLLCFLLTFFVFLAYVYVLSAAETLWGLSRLLKKLPWLMFGISYSLILTVAIFFWNFIGKYFLRKSSHYLALNQGGEL